MDASPFKTLHLTLWQEFIKKSFIIQFIAVIYLVSYCRNLIATPPLFFLMRLGAIIGFSFLLLRPIYGLFVMIFFISGFLLADTLPMIRFFGLGSLQTTDIILGGTFLFIIGRKLYYKFFYRHPYPIIRTPLDIPLILFFITCVIALINGITIQKAGFNIAFRSFRLTSYYLFFFLITNLIRNRKDLTLFIRGVFSIALITSIVMIIQQIAGTSMPLIMGRVETLYRLGTKYEGVTRSISEGFFLIYLSFISLGCIVITRRLEGKTILLGISVIILGLGLLFSFNRLAWITLPLVFLLFFFSSPIKQKGRFISYFLVAICTVIVILLFSPIFPGRLNKIINATQENIATLSKVKGIKGREADTLSGRTKEIEYALLKIKDHPILGIGLGTWYRPIKIKGVSWGGATKTKKQESSEKASPLDERLDLDRSVLLGGTPLRVGGKNLWTKPQAQEDKKKLLAKRGFFFVETPSIIKKSQSPMFHNAILDAVMRLGLVGSVPFIWLTALGLIRGFRNWEKVQDPFLRILSIGLTVSYLGILINALTSPILLTGAGAIPIAIIWGVNEVIYRLEGIEEKR